jgi:hypothetical protein
MDLACIMEAFTPWDTPAAQRQKVQYSFTLGPNQSKEIGLLECNWSFQPREYGYIYAGNHEPLFFGVDVTEADFKAWLERTASSPEARKAMNAHYEAAAGHKLDQLVGFIGSHWVLLLLVVGAVMVYRLSRNAAKESK